jgi:Planctomycete cytochrome C
MNKKRLFSLIPLVALTLVTGCKDMGIEPDASIGTSPPPIGAVSFSTDVLPILVNGGCTGCHGGTGNLFVGTVAELLTGGDHGPAIVPGKADSSNLVRKLLTPPPFGERMPFGGAPLPDATIGVIRNWVNQGAANN